MKHLFIPYELAVIAKEKGFNEPCIAFYDGGGNKPEFVFIGEMKTLKGGFQKNEQYIFSKYPDNATAPLYQQIVDWLMENHEIWIEVTPLGDLNNWMYKIHFTTGFKNIGNRDFKKSHSEALTKAIQEAFKLIP